MCHKWYTALKIGITYRLFLSILAATSLAILSLFLIMRWNIDRGFYQYLKTLDQSRLEQMADNLEEAYAEHGNWDFLRNKPRFVIGSLLNARSDYAAADTSKKIEDDKKMPPLPQGTRGGYRSRWPFIVGKPRTLSGVIVRIPSRSASISPLRTAMGVRNSRDISAIH